MNSPSNTILLVDDDDDDVFALRRALRKAQVTNPVQVVTDGRQAIDYLAGANRFADRVAHPLPFLVFLDLKLPYHDGFEVLTWIRQRAQFEAMIVVVLTGSDEARDHQRAYALGARSYLVKPTTPEELRRLIDSLRSHWSHAAAGGPLLSAATGAEPM
ncbi:MAG TPA: response regulator [Opitutaceae bacterium]|nr:response regulator [Opitutaceae bacterium]